jgi:uncharacterized protein (DUF1499 family)
MLKTLGTIAVIVLIALPAAILIAGQFNLLSGQRPVDLGPRDGKLKPPRAEAWNTVSSQAALHPHTDYHAIAPLSYQGDGKAAFARLTSIVREKKNANVVTAEPGYLYAEFQTKWLKFVDDVEFLLDEQAGVIHMRSASRLGRKDFGVNRMRLESIRRKFSQQS